MKGRPKTLNEPVTLGVRISAQEAARIDAYAGTLKARMPHETITRSVAVRALIGEALDAWERARKS